VTSHTITTAAIQVAAPPSIVSPPVKVEAISRATNVDTRPMPPRNAPA
jgi:hypothetical protein